jgi:exosortase E/protease (VPEID-CTERM system)
VLRSLAAQPSSLALASPLARSRWRTPAIAALLPVEILLLTLGYDPSPPASALVDFAYALVHIPIAVAATLVLVLSPRAAELWERYGEDPRPHPWKWVALHLVCYLGFFVQTGWLLEGASGGRAGWHSALWAALCLAVGASWCIALAPAGAWWKFLSAERRALLGSLLVGIVVWGFGVLAQDLWRPLADWTLFFAQLILGAIYTGVEYDAAARTIGTSRMLIEIAPKCSGYEGLALVTVFVAVYLWLFRQRVLFPQALWLFPAGLLAMWVANVLRIATLVAVGTSISPEIAVQGFHSQAGWIAFTTIALGLIWVSHHAGFVTRKAAGAANDSPAAAAALLVPLVAMLATSMLTAAFSAGFDALYPIGVVVTAATLLHYRKSYRGVPFRISAVPICIGFAVFLAWIALDPRMPGPADGADARMPDLPEAVSILWIAFRLIGAVVTVPMAEELAFRGYLLRKLVASDFERVPPSRFTWLSFLGSSVLFGLLHQSWVAGTIAGAGFAVAVYHRGRLIDAVVAHMTANALIAASVLGFGWWYLWL